MDNDIEEPLLQKKTININGKDVVKKQKRKKKNKIKNEDIFKMRPLARLGFGITAYIDLLWFMVLAFALFSLMLVPTMTFFSRGIQSGETTDELSK